MNLYNFMLCSAGGHRVECDRYREEVNDDLIFFIVFDLISFFHCFCKYHKFALHIAVQRCERCFSKDSDLYKFWKVWTVENRHWT